MKPKHRKFAIEYAKDLNASQAAIRAGYSTRAAGQTGFLLLKNAEIQAAIQAKLAECELTSERVLREIGRIAFSDPAALFDDDGKLRAVQELDPHVRAAVAQVDVVKRNLTAGDGQVEEVHRVKLWDKNKALELAARYLRLLDEHREHDVKIEISWKPRAELSAVTAAPGQAIEAQAPIDVELAGEPNTPPKNHKL